MRWPPSNGQCSSIFIDQEIGVRARERVESMVWEAEIFPQPNWIHCSCSLPFMHNIVEYRNHVGRIFVFAVFIFHIFLSSSSSSTFYPSAPFLFLVHAHAICEWETWPQSILFGFPFIVDFVPFTIVVVVASTAVRRFNNVLPLTRAFVRLAGMYNVSFSWCHQRIVFVSSLNHRSHSLALIPFGRTPHIVVAFASYTALALTHTAIVSIAPTHRYTKHRVQRPTKRCRTHFVHVVGPQRVYVFMCNMFVCVRCAYMTREHNSVQRSFNANDWVRTNETERIVSECEWVCVAETKFIAASLFERKTTKNQIVVFSCCMVFSVVKAHAAAPTQNTQIKTEQK